MMTAQTETINALPLTTVKFHQLQIFRDTPMEADWKVHPERYRFRTLDEYMELFIGILRRLRPDLVVERFAGEAPPRFHCGPTWGLIRNEQLMAMLERRLLETGAWQSQLWEG